MAQTKDNLSRRDALAGFVRGAGLLAVGGFLGAIALARRGEEMVWQLDPAKCTYCGKCATNCVLNPSAVKCINAYPLCGYCNLCTGYFEPQPSGLNTGAENQLCPTNALERKWVEGEAFEYNVKPDLCIGCARCVQGCTDFGNGSLYLQVDHTLCVNCNQCSIAAACPSGAFRRVPASEAYILKTKTRA